MTTRIHHEEDRLYKLPPAIWVAGVLGCLGSHIVKTLFSSTSVTLMGGAAGAMVACPVALISALVVGSGAFFVNKNLAGPSFYTTLVVIYPLSCYKFTLLISQTPTLVAGAIVLSSLALSVAFAWVLYQKNKGSTEKQYAQV